MPGGLAYTIAQQGSIIEAVLQAVVGPQGGIASAVANQEQLWNQPYQDNCKFRVLVCFLGEKSKGKVEGNAILHRVNRFWIAKVTRGTGVNSNAGDSFYKTIGNAIPFADGLEQCREAIRSIMNICPADELPVDYDRTDMLRAKNEQGSLDEAAIYFSNAIDISAYSLTGTPPT